MLKICWIFFVHLQKVRVRVRSATTSNWRCAPKSGRARCVRATQKRVTTHTLEKRARFYESIHLKTAWLTVHPVVSFIKKKIYTNFQLKFSVRKFFWIKLRSVYISECLTFKIWHSSRLAGTNNAYCQTESFENVMVEMRFGRIFCSLL